MPIHVDSYTLEEPEVTEEGFLRLEGVVATPGILCYFRDGELVREFVPPATLRDQSFLDSLEGKPVVIEHPEGEVVGPGNHRKLSVGSVYDTQYRKDLQDWHAGENEGVVAKLILRDERGIRAFRGEGQWEGAPKRQLSPAYKIELEREDGINEYGRYDAVQVKRRAANHVALTSRGRDGRESSIRTDAFVSVDALAHQPFQSDAQPALRADSTPDPDEDEMPDDTVNLQLDGFGEVDVPKDLAPILHQWRRDQEIEISDLKEQVQQLKEKRDELQKKLDELRSAMEPPQDGGEGENETPAEEYEEGREGEMSADMKHPKGKGPAKKGSGGEGSETSTEQAMMTEDERYDSADEYYQERRRAEKAAEDLRLDSDDLKSDPIEAKRQVVNEWFDDDRAEDSSAVRVDALFEVVEEQIDDLEEARKDSVDRLNERASRDTSREDGEPTGREAYLQAIGA